MIQTLVEKALNGNFKNDYDYALFYKTNKMAVAALVEQEAEDSGSEESTVLSRYGFGPVAAGRFAVEYARKIAG